MTDALVFVRSACPFLGLFSFSFFLFSRNAAKEGFPDRKPSRKEQNRLYRGVRRKTALVDNLAESEVNRRRSPWTGRRSWLLTFDRIRNSAATRFLLGKRDLAFYNSRSPTPTLRTTVLPIGIENCRRHRPAR